MSPIEPLVLDAVGRRSFVDVGFYLPEDIRNNSDDVVAIVRDHVLVNLKSAIVELEDESLVTTSVGVIEMNHHSTELCTFNDGSDGMGLVVAINGGCFYFSSRMVRDIRTKIFSSLAEILCKDYGNEHFEELLSGTLDAVPSQVTVDTGHHRMTTLGRRLKKGSSRRKHCDGVMESDSNAEKTVSTLERKKFATERQNYNSIKGNVGGVLPLYHLAKSIADAYPDLKEIQEDILTLNSDLKWKSSASAFEGPIVELCRSALYVDAEELLSKVLRSKLEKEKSLNMGGTTNQRDHRYLCAIEKAFEEVAFPAACHDVQLFSRLANLIVDDADQKLIERDFLDCVASDFAKRLTQYCLIKNGVGVETYLFSFSAKLMVRLSSSRHYYALK